MIIRSYGKQAFTITKNYINVTIPLSTRNEQTTKKVKNKVDEKLDLNESQKQILSLIEQNPKYTITDLMGLTNLSRSYISKIISQLKDKNIITRTGSKKNGIWKIN